MNARQQKKRNKVLFYVGVIDALHKAYINGEISETMTLKVSKVSLAHNQHNFYKHVKFGKRVCKYLI